MILEMSKLEMPNWLKECAVNIHYNKPVEFNLENLLKDSLYYPACGLNGTPIKYLSGNIYSFVYCDYLVRKEELLRNLLGNDDESGLLGYKMVYQTEITKDMIVPTNWTPSLLPESYFFQKLSMMERQAKTFGHWSIWQRDEDRDDTHGSEYISLLYFAGEMSAIYQGLYIRLKIAPLVLSIIQPGTMGGEWENVTSNNSFFKRVINANTAGLPKYLLYGGFGGEQFYTSPCWSDYDKNRLTILPERYAGLFKISN